MREDVISFLENEVEEIGSIIDGQSSYKPKPEEIEKLRDMRADIVKAICAVKEYPDLIDVLAVREDED